MVSLNDPHQTNPHHPYRDAWEKARAVEANLPPSDTLRDWHDHLSALTWSDPPCDSGRSTAPVTPALLAGGGDSGTTCSNPSRSAVSARLGSPPMSTTSSQSSGGPTSPSAGQTSCPAATNATSSSIEGSSGR